MKKGENLSYGGFRLIIKGSGGIKNMKFECEIITPMFISGADGHTPELRPPSIKGMLRFWWRALNGHLGLIDLKKNEAIKFGSSDEKIGKSKIIIRVSNDNLKKRNYKLLPHKSNFVFAQYQVGI
jgi:CRISPR-associated protein Cmr1